MMFKLSSSLLTSFVFVVGYRAVHATLSIAAVDNSTNRIGAAGTSCVAAPLSQVLYTAAVPGTAVLVTQAVPPEEESTYTLARELLENGTDPSLVLDTLYAVDTTETQIGQEDGMEYPARDLRQYGCVDLQSRAAGFTGNSIKAYYFSDGDTEEEYNTNYTQEDIQGTYQTFTYSAQGNIVAYNTVDTLVEGFVGSAMDQGCDLADRLYRAVTAVDDAITDTNFVGDVRCIEANWPGFSAFVHVDNPDGTVALHIDVVGDPNNQTNPIDRLRTQYEAWRMENPCPAISTDPPTSSPPTISPEMGEMTNDPTGMPTKAPSSSGKNLALGVGACAYLIFAAFYVFEY